MLTPFVQARCSSTKRPDVLLTEHGFVWNMTKLDSTVTPNLKSRLKKSQNPTYFLYVTDLFAKARWQIAKKPTTNSQSSSAQFKDQHKPHVPSLASIKRLTYVNALKLNFLIIIITSRATLYEWLIWALCSRANIFFFPEHKISTGNYELIGSRPKNTSVYKGIESEQSNCFCT